MAVVLLLDHNTCSYLSLLLFLEAPNPNKAAGDIDEFIRLQSELLNRLRNEAAAGGSKSKYAQENGPGPLDTTFFAAVQCTPDLSEKDCNDCLNFGFENATKGRLGIRWFCPSCSFQIESNLRFFLLEREYEPDLPSGPGPEPGRQSVTKPGPDPGLEKLERWETVRDCGSKSGRDKRSK
ncbi:hypothetical protein Bca52824_002355 [Brassica carinata]|uniref:Gnk2-homologous domain-containing protein n=1 Tax=Brassica carinata TaxID=52824 RepID=A0A8X7WL02_BRACI|nr:hypothetical protein Bca52824_002355 [Brassica carinata]